MIILYDNPFSPFARKVRMVLWFKQVPFESIDALATNEHERLLAVNPRAEVPVLVDEDLIVANSAEIAAYLEDRFPTPALLPPSPELRAKARSWPSSSANGWTAWPRKLPPCAAGCRKSAKRCARSC